MPYVLYAILAAVVLFVLVLVLRAANFKPRDNVAVVEKDEDFDREVTISRLQKLIRFKTVSYRESEKEDDEEFKKLLSSLPELYPNVFKVCEYNELADRAILFHWKGKNEGDAAVLMAHYDVVPVEESGWEKPAFEGILEDGVLWGRGALDTKVTFNGVLSAADHLISEGFTPEYDIYFAFSGGEEVNGKGAVNIVDFFEQNNITPSIVVDEGGAVVENVFPGVKAPCGLIGIAEKGMMDVRYTAQSSGGHASAPKPNSPLVRLSKVCLKLDKNIFKYHITKPAALMFDTLGRHSSFVFKLVFSNLWLFRGLIDKFLCKKSGGEINALLRTTVAFTQASGSRASNVIPPKAEMVSNIRLNPEDTIDSALAELKAVCDKENVEVELIHGMNPSRISVADCEAYDKVASAVASTWKGSIVSPYLMVQCSDSRHWGRLSDKVYRFSAMDLTSEERATIHGHNERIRVDCANRAVEFYIRLVRTL